MFYTTKQYGNVRMSGNFSDAWDAFLEGHIIEEPKPQGRTEFRITREAYAIQDRHRLGITLDHGIRRALAIASTTHPEVTDDSYYTFKIPKASGGMRTITAPTTSLKDAQRFILNGMKHQGLDDMMVLEHDCAYAYIKGRSIKHALEHHQENESKWFLKLDIKDFFPSCTEDILRRQLRNLYPLSNIQSDQLEGIIHYATYKGSLPQGGVLSPYLSNLIMVEVDYLINRILWVHKGNHYVYTRYSDDMLISSKRHFDKEDIIKVIQEQLDILGMKLNQDKIRYGSSAGRNWNLGLMLNKDNNITIGYRNKKELKNEIYRFLVSASLGEHWSVEHVQSLVGNVAHFKYVEPEYAQYVIRRQERKAGISWQEAVKYAYIQLADQ